MQVTKLSAGNAGNGLIPAGRYFEKLAHALRDENDREAQRQRALDAEDRELESLYRRASATRSNTYVEAHTMM